MKSSWRRLQNVLENKNMLPWRHLQDIFEASSVRLRQGECFLGYDKVKLFKSIESIPKRTNFARISPFRFNWFWYYLEKRSISSFANNNGSLNHHLIQRHIQNLSKVFNGAFCENSEWLKVKNIFTKSSIIDFWQGPKYA